MNEKISLEIKPLSFGNTFSCAEETKKKKNMQPQEKYFLVSSSKNENKGEFAECVLFIRYLSINSSNHPEKIASLTLHR